MRHVGVAVVALLLAAPSAALAADPVKTYRFSVRAQGKPALPTGLANLGLGEALDSAVAGSGSLAVSLPPAGPARVVSARGTVRVQLLVERGPKRGFSVKVIGAGEIWPGRRSQYGSSEGTRLWGEVTATNLPGCERRERAIVHLLRRPKLLAIVQACGVNLRYEPKGAAGPAVTVAFTPRLP